MGLKPLEQKLRVAVTQHEPVWLDLQGTVDKTCDIIKEAAEAGAKLLTFPECWVCDCFVRLHTYLVSIVPLAGIWYTHSINLVGCRSYLWAVC
jgi:hypothetical protein